MKRYGAAILAVIALLAAPLGVPALVAQQHGDLVGARGAAGQAGYAVEHIARCVRNARSIPVC